MDTKQKSARMNARLMAGALVVMGTLHFVRPKPFDELIPPELPGQPRLWTYLSGVAELVTACLLANPKTQKLGAKSAFALFLAVWPGNWQMARDAKNASALKKAIAYLRIPLQLPMFYQARYVDKNTK